MRRLPHASPLALGSLASLTILACTQGTITGTDSSGSPGAPARNPVQPEPSTVSFDQRLDLFSGDAVPNLPKYFDMILGDMDLDGDLDCFLNRHNLHRFEAFENVGGSFEQFNRRGEDTSGLWDNPGVPDLYARGADIAPEIDALGVPGVYVWHGESITGRWFLRVVPALGSATHSLRVTTNRPLVDQLGLVHGEIERVSDVEVTIDLDVTAGPRTFGIGNLGVNTQLKVALEDSAPLGLFAGTNFLEYPSGEASLWKQDPHGLALVDGIGSSEPDLYISGGGLAGNHLPPHDPQADRLFESMRQPGQYREVAPGVLPPDYGRGRQVAWIDMDSDGVNELYVTNKATPNVLLELDSGGTFIDIAPGLELDLVGPEAIAWSDIDSDGELDLVFLDGNEIKIAYRRGPTFEIFPGSGIGLVLPPDPSSGGSLFESSTLQIVDMDRDGDLDLWVVQYSSEDRIATFRNDGDTYVDVTEALGFSDFTGLRHALLADIDNDGWMDLVTFGTGIDSGLDWWRNLLGESFERDALDDDFAAPLRHWFTAGDVDLDGTIDIVLMTGFDRQVLLNRTKGPNTLLEVHPDLPLGTVIRAYHPDGTIFAQAWGAATVSRYSQTLQPLRFGQAPGAGVTQLGVQLPGDASERYRVNVPAGARRIDI